MEQSFENGNLDMRLSEKTITGKSNNINLSVISSPTSCKVGDVITYILQITAPKGVVANNIQLIDTFPCSKQEFIQNSILKDGLLMSNQLEPLEGVLTFPIIPFIDGSQGEVKLTYSFEVRVKDATTNNNFVDIQNNTVDLEWEDASTGSVGTTITNSTNIYVQLPSIQLNLFQSNVTNNIEYTTENIEFKGGDILSYKIEIVNAGKNTSYNVDLMYNVSNYFIVDSTSLSGTKGNGEFLENSLSWNIDSIKVGEVISISFNVTGSNNIPPIFNVQSNASTTFNSNNNGFGKIFNNIKSNSLNTNINNIDFNIISSVNIVKERELFSYIVTLNLYKGSVIEDVLIYDTLPQSIEYVGNATKQINSLPAESINPTVDTLPGGEQKIIFPQPIVGLNNSIDASNEEIQIIYTFNVRVESVTRISPYIEYKTNNGGVQWISSIMGSEVQEKLDSEDIEIQVSNINVIVEQKNLTIGGDYTTQSIMGLPDNIIAYKITVNSTGVAPVYNLNIENEISNDVIFQGTLNGPSSGIVTTPNDSSKGSVIWKIPNLNSGESIIYEFTAKIKNKDVLGKIINNSAYLQYGTSNGIDWNYFGFSNILDMIVGGVSVNTTTNSTDVSVGDDITYNIEITIPKGNTLYSLIVTEILDKGQEFKKGTWTSSLGDITEPKVINSGTYIEYIEFKAPISNSSDTNLVITYTFKVKVISGSPNSASKQTQTSITNVTWANSIDGTEVNPIVDSAKVSVSRPYITISKVQKNLTQGGAGFIDEPLKNVNIGNRIEYQLYITNVVGASRANNIVIKDQLPSNLQYISGADSVLDGLVTINLPFLPDTGLVHKSIIAEVKSSFTDTSSDVNSFTVTYNGSTTNTDVTLGPIESNKVGLNYVPPQINAYVYNKTAVFVGDTITYKCILTVLKGNILYNVQPRFTLPVEQQYIENSLSSVGGTEITSSLNLDFPSEETINAIAEDKTITYTFQAKVINTTSDSQNNQQGTATVEWNINNSGIVGQPQNATTNVYVMGKKITFTKRQGLDGSNYGITNLNVKMGQRIYYGLEISNPSSVTVYNIDVSDVTPSGVIIQSLDFINTREKFVLKNSSIIGVTNLKFNIYSLDPNEVITVTYSGMLVGPSVLGTTIESAATLTYNGNGNTLNAVYGPINSNNVTVTISEDSIEFIKTSNNNLILLGETSEYSLTLKIPKGIVLYNVQVVDNIPNEESFTGVAYLNGKFEAINEEGKILRFTPINKIDTSSGAKAWNYMLETRLSSMKDDSISEKILQNNGLLSWQTTESGGNTLNISTQLTVQGIRAILNPYQLQRDVTKNQNFDFIDINADVGDMLEFKLIIKNSSLTAAYDLRVKYYLDESYEYINTVSVNMGIIQYVGVYKYVSWNIDSISPSEEATATIQVKVSQNMPAGSIISNNYSVSYSSVESNRVIESFARSNGLTQRYSYISIISTTEKSEYNTGEIVTYNVTLTVPGGAKFYNLQVNDVLPVSQTFINSNLNGNPIVPDVRGQLITFPPINSNTLNVENKALVDNKKEINEKVKGISQEQLRINLNTIYNYEINAMIDVTNIIDGKLGVQTNSTNVIWSQDPNDRFVIGPISNTDSIRVGENLILVEKFQRQKGTEEFTKNNITIFTGEQVEYKIIVSNIGKNVAYNVSVEDTLNNSLLFLQVNEISQGNISLEYPNTLMWNITERLLPMETEELIYEIEVRSSVKKSITNIAIPSYSLGPTESIIEGVSSNETFIDVDLPPVLSRFIPNKNSYVSDTKALSYGIVGCKGKVGYILYNYKKEASTFNLKIGSIPFSYKLFINGIFVEEIEENSIYNVSPKALINLETYTPVNIDLVYNIPSWYSISTNPVHFDITVNDIDINKPMTINNQLNLGNVIMTNSYNIKEYTNNPSMFLIDYEISLNISKGIKLYDVELKVNYPPSCIFNGASIDGNSVKVISLSGEIIYPTNSVIDTTNSSLSIKYNYNLFQYKKTPLGVGNLEQNSAILSLRTAKNIENKCIFETSTLKNLNKEALTCIYPKKVFGRCKQYYYYCNIDIPTISGYSFEKIIFQNPRVIKNTLNIVPSTYDKDFSQVMYSFEVPYNIIYIKYDCLKVEKKIILQVLPQKKSQIIIYTPRDKENYYDIVLETKVENIVYDNKGYFNACLVIITSSISKDMTLINNLGECDYYYCCPSCNNTNNQLLT